MKRITNLAILALLGLSSCTQEFTYDPTQEIKENAENIFGLIDPNQDWRTTTSGTVTVTANAPLSDITKVQILTGSPFFNKDAKILAETEAKAGQTVTLSYDAPRTSTRLIAACVNSNGKYYIQGFNIGDEDVSFKSSSAPAATRGAAITRAGDELQNISLDFKSSFMSYNAERAKSTNDTYSSWQGSNWENDRLWQLTSSGNPDGWTVSNNTIYINAPALSAEEEANLEIIFEDALGRYEKNKPKNNLPIIKESSVVRLYGNHLISTGDAAITLTPVQAASTEAYWCDIYYYYYRTEDVPDKTPEGEANYIKTLPKFKAIDVNEVRDGISAVTGTQKTNLTQNSSDSTNIFCLSMEMLQSLYPSRIHLPRMATPQMENSIVSTITLAIIQYQHQIILSLIATTRIICRVKALPILRISFDKSLRTPMTTA